MCRPPTAATASTIPRQHFRCARWARIARNSASSISTNSIDRQGVVHVIGPEQGFTLPGTTIVCGDSHTSTHGAFGALAFGIGTSEVEHVLATQTLIQKKAKNMRVTRGRRAWRRRHRQGHRAGDHRRDRHGGRHGLRHRIRRRGDPRAVHGRPHDGLQHVDRGRRPGRHDRARREDLRLSSGPAVRSARRRLGHGAGAIGRRLPSDEGAAFDREVRTRRRRPCRRMSPGAPAPRMSSRSPARCPIRRTPPIEGKRAAIAARAGLHGLDARHADRPTSPSTACSSAPAPMAASRICARRRRSCDGQRIVGPASTPWWCRAQGSSKQQAEAEGLDKIFLDAGFEWREPGCSMCLAMNADRLAPGERCASTSNRNFEGRQGTGAARTSCRPPWPPPRPSPATSPTCADSGNSAPPNAGREAILTRRPTNVGPVARLRQSWSLHSGRARVQSLSAAAMHSTEPGGHRSHLTPSVPDIHTSRVIFRQSVSW